MCCTMYTMTFIQWHLNYLCLPLLFNHAFIHKNMPQPFPFSKFLFFYIIFHMGVCVLDPCSCLLARASLTPQVTKTQRFELAFTVWMDIEPYAKLWEIIEPGSYYAGRSDSQFAVLQGEDGSHPRAQAWWQALYPTFTQDLSLCSSAWAAWVACIWASCPPA